MSFPTHIIEQIDGSAFNWTDRVRVGMIASVDSGATGDTASVTKEVTFYNYELPATSFGAFAMARGGTTAVVATTSAFNNNGVSVTLTALTGNVPENCAFDLFVVA